MSKIIVNGMFVGSYGTNAKNLPHEVINIYQADDENCYVYIAPYGRFPKKVDSKDSSTKILFVHSVGNGLMEIVAKAEDIQEVYTSDLELSQTRKKVKCLPTSQIPQLDECILNNITYGGCPLHKLYETNVDDIKIYVTCKVDKIYLPKKTSYITTNKSKEKYSAMKEQVYTVSTDRRINNSSMTITFDENDNGYADLNSILQNTDIWGNAVTKLDLGKASINNGENNFFKMTLQQNSEVMFSNALFYFLSSNEEILRKFINNCLNLRNCSPNKNCTVAREENRMDISIKQEDFYIIIENKIKSGINGIKEKGNKLIESQLSKYYDEAYKQMQEDENKIHCFLLHANYDKFVLSSYKHGKKYGDITYKDLYTFFSELEKELEKNKSAYGNFFTADSFNGATNACFLHEFVKALEKHTHEVDDEFRNDLLQRMAERVNAYNNRKNSNGN